VLPQLSSVSELVLALRRGEIELADYTQQLENVIELCRRRQQRLPQIEVTAEDQLAWDTLIRPGLLASYRCVAAAAEEARLYGQKPNPALLPGISKLLNNAERINHVLADSLKMLSGWTRDQIAQELADRIQIYQREGLATSELPFIEPDGEA